MTEITLRNERPFCFAPPRVELMGWFGSLAGKSVRELISGLSLSSGAPQFSDELDEIRGMSNDVDSVRKWFSAVESLRVGIQPPFLNNSQQAQTKSGTSIQLPALVLPRGYELIPGTKFFRPMIFTLEGVNELFAVVVVIALTLVLATVGPREGPSSRGANAE